MGIKNYLYMLYMQLSHALIKLSIQSWQWSSIQYTLNLAHQIQAIDFWF